MNAMLRKFWKILCLLLLGLNGCSLPSCDNDSACLRILFIGNSYTFVNDLPNTFENLAKSGGHRVETDIRAEGGWSLPDHANSSRTLRRIRSQKWDFVVLQEQSQIPASQQLRSTEMYPAARALVAKIREADARPIFLMTWAHRSGWPENGLSSYESMQAAIDTGYMEIGKELDAIMVPAGDAWSNSLQQNPQINLWQEDGSHPSEQGTYLTACVFYAVIYHESPEGLSYIANLSDEEAASLQNTAVETVLNDSAHQNIP